MTGGNKNGGGESERCFGMADAKVHQRCVKISRTSKLLPTVHRRVRNSGKYYDLKLKVLSSKTTLILSNTRELNRVPSTKYLPYVLLLISEPSTPFSQVP